MGRKSPRRKDLNLLGFFGQLDLATCGNMRDIAREDARRNRTPLWTELSDETTEFHMKEPKKWVINVLMNIYINEYTKVEERLRGVAV